MGKLFSQFEASRKEHEGVEYWSGRDLLLALGYDSRKWSDFKKNVIGKAIEACKQNGHDPNQHFMEGSEIGNSDGTGKIKEDMILSRYGCYLSAINGNPRYPQVAFAQQYFVETTRRLEVIQQRLLLEDKVNQERIETRKKYTETFKDFSATLQDHGIRGPQFGVVVSKGDVALFNGFSTKDMKKRYGVPDSKPMPDVAPDVVNAARELANQMTKLNLRKKGIFGEFKITREHEDNNKGVRKALLEREIVPEDLPPEEDTKVIASRMRATMRRISHTQERKTLSMGKAPNESKPQPSKPKEKSSAQIDQPGDQPPLFENLD
jgi:DNA-damage-inducible protein D